MKNKYKLIFIIVLVVLFIAVCFLVFPKEGTAVEISFESQIEQLFDKFFQSKIPLIKEIAQEQLEANLVQSIQSTSTYNTLNDIKCPNGIGTIGIILSDTLYDEGDPCIRFDEPSYKTDEIGNKVGEYNY
jgi:predicted membrane protein